MGSNKIALPKQYESLTGFLNKKDLLKIQSSVILLAGCGAGSNVAHLLTRYGAGTKNKGTLIFADPDIVSKRNLTRQLYTSNDVGFKKVDALSKSCLAINPSIKIKRVPSGITAKNVSSLVKKSDLIFEMVDISAPEVSYLIHQKAYQFKKPVIITLDLGDNTLTRVFSNRPKSLSFMNFFGLPDLFPADEFAKLNPYAIVTRLIIGPCKTPLISHKKIVNYYSDKFFTMDGNLQNLLNNVPVEMKPLITAIISGKLNFLPQTGIAGQILGAVHMKLAQSILMGKSVPNATKPIKIYLSELTAPHLTHQ